MSFHQGPAQMDVHITLGPSPDQTEHFEEHLRRFLLEYLRPTSLQIEFGGAETTITVNGKSDTDDAELALVMFHEAARDYHMEHSPHFFQKRSEMN